MSRAACSLAMQFISPLELCEVDSVDHSVFSSFVTGSLSTSLSTVFSNKTFVKFRAQHAYFRVPMGLQKLTGHYDTNWIRGIPRDCFLF